jgi:peptidoglycan/LPS O-acetylase OafA/YrhL
MLHHRGGSIQLETINAPILEAGITGAKTGKGVRLDFIDGIRALAALYVMLGHAYFEPTNAYYSTHFMSRLGLTYGHLAVDVFIVVSGFCLMLPAARRDDQLGSIKEFFRRRIRRILPPYYAALALSILFIATVAHATDTGTVWDICPPLTVTSILQHLFLVQDFSQLMTHSISVGEHSQLNYVLWSIAVEAQIYLFMPFVVISLRRFGNLPTLFWTSAVGLIAYFKLGHQIEPAHPWYLGLFCCGAIAARQGVKLEGEPRRAWSIAAYAVTLLTAVVILGAGNKRFRQHPMFFDELVGIAAALLLYVLFTDAATQRHRLSRMLSWRPLVAVGLFSYSLYLIHAPLIHACYLVLNPLLHPRPEVMFLLLVCCLPLIVAAAHAFYTVFERPFLNIKR